MDVGIPDFLRIPQEVRKEAWRGRKLTKPVKDSVKITRNEDAQTRAFRREIEKQAKAKRDARFAVLREKAALAKRQAVR
jgi:hypothetical protein